MTTTGKVFCVLNVLAAIFYAYLTAPVAQYRSKMQKQIQDGVEQVEKLREEADQLDADRVELLRQISEEETTTAVLKASLAQRKQESDRIIAELDDTLKYTRALLTYWTQTVAKTSEEIESRTKEIADLDGEIEKAGEMFKIRSNEVADLETRLKDAETALAKYLDEMGKNLKKLLAAEDETEKKAANLAGGRDGAPPPPVGP